MDMSDSRLETVARDLQAFMDTHVHPVEHAFYEAIDTTQPEWHMPPLLEELKSKAREAGLWNLFVTRDYGSGAGLTNRQYARLGEIMGRVLWAPEVFNCSAPDTGNMEVLLKFGSVAQQRQWLDPLLRGVLRSVFCMTEPDVASSDATNIATRIERRGDTYVVNGRKWFASGAMNPRAEIFFVMGKTDPDAARHKQQSIVLVPRGTPGLSIVRHMPVYAGTDAHFGGHAEVTFENVEIPAANLILGEGRGFEIAQGRLGPGRVHHCMRLIGIAERALEAMCQRSIARVAFGRPLADFGTIRLDIARSRAEIEQARLLVLRTAELIDAHGAKNARREIALIKLVTPDIVAGIVDRAIQAHGAAGVTNDHFLARAWVYARTIRLADGPDAVHAESIARGEIAAMRERLAA